jgi:hypothetical protein
MRLKDRENDENIKVVEGIHMRKYIITIIAALFCLLGINIHFATANTWTAKTDFGGVARNDAVGFSIGSRGYIGMGEYDSSFKNGF